MKPERDVQLTRRHKFSKIKCKMNHLFVITSEFDKRIKIILTKDRAILGKLLLTLGLKQFFILSEHFIISVLREMSGKFEMCK